jgi:pilus assembly protein Flp/PilA
MKAKWKNLLSRFLGDETAPSAIEYAMLTAGVAVLIIAVVYMLGSGANSKFQQAAPMSPNHTTSPNPPSPR